ncbi:MAG: SCO family protein [Thermoanaerobaculia bacterium]
MKISTRAAAILPAILLCLPLPAPADDCHSEHAAEPARPAAAAEAAKVGSMNIPDVELVDQDGNEVHFFSDLVEDRVVAMNFIFTTCTTICPPMGANFSKLQKLLGEDTRVEMISVSVDPVVDTPQRLKIWGDKFGRAPGWTLLTGSKAQVDRLLKSLQVFTADKTDHSPIVLLGNAASNRWTRTYGLTAPAQLAEMVAKLADGQQFASVTETEEGR